MSERYRIASYLRLSKEDEDIKEESNSIRNQRIMLTTYIKEHFEQYEWKEFVDDGFSGTNLYRPGVMELLEQAKDGMIDCVIVKDFSRFSRDYIELGSYLEQIFPFLGVRFISINDNYDSAGFSQSTANLDTVFQGLMYDLYSKDLSLKIKSSLRARKEQGQYACANVPFGYAKDRNDRHRLIIAEEEAQIVRKIFDLSLEGKTSSQIAKLLNQENVPTPSEFQIKKKQIRQTLLQDHVSWNPSVVWSILKNLAYVGDMVYDKYEKEAVGGKNHLKPRSEWKVYKGHHDAIITRDVFDKVQKTQKQRKTRNSKNGGHKTPLQGKVICGGCQRAMTLRNSRNPYFYCSRRYVYANAKQCVCHVNRMFLEQVILSQMDIEFSRQEKSANIHETIENRKKDNRQLLRKKAALQRKRLENYEKSVFNAADQFPKESTAIEQIEEQIRQTEYEIKGLEEELKKQEESFTELFCRGYGTTITNELLETQIKKIVVYDEQHIEIEWKFKEKNAVALHDKT